MTNLRVLFSFLAVLLFARGVRGSHGVATKERRGLQYSYGYELEVTAVYGFVFKNGTSPELSPSVAEMEELVRLTEIFYRRTFASDFPSAYKGIILSYTSHTWEPSQDTLTVAFGASLTFQLMSDIPTDDEVWGVFTHIDSENYIRHFASMAEPSELFLWTNSAEIEANLLGTTPVPSSKPTGATALSLFEPPVVADASNVSQPTPTAAPSKAFERSPTFQHGDFGSAPTHEEDLGAQGGSIGTGVETGFHSDEATISEENQMRMMSAFFDEFTASKMFFWMIFVRIVYYVAGIVLERWAYSYQGSSKKVHWVSYWIQFILYVPLLGVLTLSLVAIQNANDDLVKIGLRFLSHAIMLLLAMYGMEIFLRSMDNTLLAQRCIFIATILCVVNLHDPGLQSLMDGVTFGAMESIGVCSELAAQWTLINYRSWSDASPHEQGRIRHGVAYTLQVCLSCSFIAKLLFFSSSVVWYVFRFDALAGSYVVYVLPSVRLIQVPFLLRSFFVQTRLYNRVAAVAPPEDMDAKNLESGYDDCTEDGSQQERNDV